MDLEGCLEEGVELDFMVEFGHFGVSRTYCMVLDLSFGLVEL